MQYFKSAAKSVWNVSKSYIVDTRSQAEKLIDQIMLCNEEIIPTLKLNQLADMTYQIEKFQQIIDILLLRLKVFKYDIDEARKTLNLLIAVNYLVKHGATAFVDEFRRYIGYFNQYKALKQQKVYQDQTEQKRLDYQIQKIKSRASHIQSLLQDKQKLLKQKQLSMLIKQKMKLYQKNKLSQISISYSSQTNSQTIHNQQARFTKINQQIDNVMEKYLWKYVDKLDDKIQSISEKVLQKIDKYVLGELPQNNFEFDDQQEHQDNKLQDDDQFMKNLQKEAVINSKIPQNCNLLQFQEVVHEPKIPKQQSLI